MLTIGQAESFLKNSGVPRSQEQIRVLLETGEIRNGIYDQTLDEWRIEKDDLKEYIRRSRPQRWWVKIGVGGTASVALLATLAGNFKDVAEFTCQQANLMCPREKPPSNVLPFSLSIMTPESCPAGYQVPPDEEKKVLGLYQRSRDVGDVIEQVNAKRHYQFVGTRSVILRLSGTEFKGFRPVTSNNIRFEVNRVGAGPSPALTLYRDECGGGLENFSFKAVSLKNSPSPYIASSDITRDSSSDGKPVKLTIEPGEPIEILGRLECGEDGTYEVTAIMRYDVGGDKQPPIMSEPLKMVCPKSILSLNDLNIDANPVLASLERGFYVNR